MITRRGPVHRWFAWRPVDTDDRGWRWLRIVWRRRIWDDGSGVHSAVRWWRYAVRRDGL